MTLCCPLPQLHGTRQKTVTPTLFMCCGNLTNYRMQPKKVIEYRSHKGPRYKLQQFHGTRLENVISTYFVLRRFDKFSNATKNSTKTPKPQGHTLKLQHSIPCLVVLSLDRQFNKKHSSKLQDNRGMYLIQFEGLGAAHVASKVPIKICFNNDIIAVFCSIIIQQSGSKPNEPCLWPAIRTKEKANRKGN